MRCRLPSPRTVRRRTGPPRRPQGGFLINRCRTAMLPPPFEVERPSLRAPTVGPGTGSRPGTAAIRRRRLAAGAPSAVARGILGADAEQFHCVEMPCSLASPLAKRSAVVTGAARGLGGRNGPGSEAALDERADGASCPGPIRDGGCRGSRRSTPYDREQAILTSIHSMAYSSIAMSRRRGPRRGATGVSRPPETEWQYRPPGRRSPCYATCSGSAAACRARRGRRTVGRGPIGPTSTWKRCGTVRVPGWYGQEMVVA